ncbi:hypothetical protein EZ428_05190 [Pedobacter frigiditerrae]|uniref:Uncharacterized protein n=1 Tax=Pedobacter frigiditerrae TaxID=2530452 RepID=A0A4R0N350_9SPHI|nr:hypothetical protein [Pedobacter frigiditerrae]TCC94175.1 hypothetical protein EZ428_05190 [Pedobacter frigiditerrae]
MIPSKKTFQKYILPVIIAGILGWFFNHYLTNEPAKLVSREITINKNVDGSVTERKMEIYK